MVGWADLEQADEILPVDIPYILIVESDPDIAMLLQQVVKSELHLGTLFAATIKDAAKVTSILRPILFLINENLSDGDGIALYDELHRRAAFEHIPALILSTQPRLCQPRARERRLRCLEIPFDLDDLLGGLASLLSFLPTSPRRQKIRDAL